MRGSLAELTTSTEILFWLYGFILCGRLYFPNITAALSRHKGSLAMGPYHHCTPTPDHAVCFLSTGAGLSAHCNRQNTAERGWATSTASSEEAWQLSPSSPGRQALWKPSCHTMESTIYKHSEDTHRRPQQTVPAEPSLTGILGSPWTTSEEASRHSSQLAIWYFSHPS